MRIIKEEIGKLRITYIDPIDKQGVVELITKKKSNEMFDWLDFAKSAPVKTTREDMNSVYRGVMDFKERVGTGNCLEDYYNPAFYSIQGAYHRKNFEEFKEGLEELLWKIARN